MRLAVAATAPLGAAILEGLADRHSIELLLTRPDRPRGRGRKPGPNPAKETAARLGIRIETPERLETFPGDSHTVVVAAYGVLIPESLLEERLWLNVHPSLLPRWRGAAPVERAIMAGDIETGITIHQTTPELDAGPIAAQRAFAIAPTDDAGAVYDKAAKLALELLDEVLPNPQFTEQPSEGVTYAEKIVAADREIDWSAGPDAVVAKVRALAPHIGARVEVDGRRLLVWSAKVAEDDAKLVHDGVELLEVQPEGRRRMSAAEYLRGLR